MVSVTVVAGLIATLCTVNCVSTPAGDISETVKADTSGTSEVSRSLL